MSRAPFCNVEVAKIPGKPGDAAHRAGVNISTIPSSASQQQIINIINRNFQNIIQNFFGQFAPTPSNPAPFAPNKNVSPGQEDWKEVTRKTKVVRVFNESDPTQFVDVEQINALTMKNKKTGETWVWSR